MLDDENFRKSLNLHNFASSKSENLIMLFQLLQAAGIDTIAAAQAASMPVVPHQEEIHLLDMAFKGGWLMLVLLALSIVAIYLSERNGG